MKIEFGRRQLAISLNVIPLDCREKCIGALIRAREDQLTRFQSQRTLAFDRARQETNALLFGAARLRTP